MDVSQLQDTPLNIIGITELMRIAKDNANSLSDAVTGSTGTSVFQNELSSYIMRQYQINRDAKQTSGVEDMILNSLRAYNGVYDPIDHAKIKKGGGSDIFMNITATKCRAAASWIRDILLSANEKAWTLRPTPLPELPTALSETIDKALHKEFGNLIKDFKLTPESQEEAPDSQGGQEPEGPQAPAPPVPGQPPQPGQKPKSKVDQAQQTIRDVNQSKRDIKDAIYHELEKEAKWNSMVLERMVEDDLVEGNWHNALSDFIDDFTVFPTAILKGPIVSKKKQLVWENGEAVESKDTIFMNKVVNPLDAYPAPEAEDAQHGNFCEHLRLFPAEVYGLIGAPEYQEDKLRSVLSEFKSDGVDYQWMDTSIEEEKAEQEKKGTSSDANRNVIHGIHFFGSVPGKTLKEWGVRASNATLMSDVTDDEAFYEVEAIVLGNYVVKCVVNDDPLLRRPYYTASYQRRPGSFWGRSLPNLMSDVQRMCNASARALANNMALASGPQIEIYVDRLADNGDIQAIEPFTVWQLTSDPTGGGGRAINFYQPDSNAQALMAVYDKFEEKADDATGIPRYAYGNEKVQGAAATASGLSMLLESASKGIKDAIRNIDSGVIVPRVEHQFYYLLSSNDDITYTGDVKVQALGSSALTVKGAEQLKRQEFLKITSNEFDQKIMGQQGRTALLREMAKDLGFTEDIVPSRLDVKKKEEEDKEAQAGAQQAEQQAKKEAQELSLKGASMQIEGQKEMNQLTQKIKMLQEENKKQQKAFDNEVTKMRLQLEAARLQADVDHKDKERATKEKLQTQEAAIKVTSGSGL